MATYLIGDVQGCDDALGRLLDTLAFSPSRDTICLLGDLVNRGPASLAVLRRLMALADSAHCLLGNHDLHLLAVSHGVRKPHRSDTVQDILNAPERQDLLTWLRHRPMAMQMQGWLLVHAGVLPQWDALQTMALAREFERELQGADWGVLMHNLYGNTPDQWHPSLQGYDRLRVIVNALTRLRFCSVDGVMEFNTKDGANAAPEGFLPWFEVPGRQTANTLVAFGHWSTLGEVHHCGVLPLDTGCVWGGCLTAARLGDQPGAFERISVPCPQAKAPDLWRG